jgi:competence protein ComEC
LVLFSAGYGNRFGFPKASVLRRVERVGAKHLTTAAAGAISFRLSPRSGVVGPDLYREQEPRYWRHRPGGFGG